LLAGLIIPAGITMLFAAWEYLEFKFRYSERWKPESLPPVSPPIRQTQARPVVRITGGVVWLIFWALALFSPSMFWVWGGRGVFSPSETVYAMRLPLWLLIFFWISQSWLRYTRFATVEWRRFLCMAINVVGLALAIYLLRGGDLLVPGPNWVPAQAKPLATLNQMVAGVMVIACIFLVLGWVQELRRSVQRLGRDRQTA